MSMKSVLFQDYSINKWRDFFLCTFWVPFNISFLIKIIKILINHLPRDIGKNWPEFLFIYDYI